MQRLEHLYGKYLNGIISESEKQELFELIRQADDDALKQIVDNYLGATPPENLDHLQPHTDEILQRINLRIANENQKPRRVKALYKYIIAAAGLLAVSIVGFYMWRNTQPTTPQLTSIYGDDVAPGGNRATITLSDGTTLNLSEAQRGVVVSQNEMTYTDGSEVISAAEEIEHATLSTPRGGQYQLTLPDGSKVWLNAESSLKYPIAFSDHERRVTLSGEGFFEVKEDARKPFIVESLAQTLRVTGTTFNINSYDDLPTVTTLASGSVSLTDHSGKSTSLKPGQQSLLQETGFTIRNVDASDYTSWKDGLIVFNEATFNEVARDMERWYDVSFTIPDNLDSGKAYILLNRNEKLSELLHSLEKAYEIQFTISGKEVVVKK